MSGASINPGLHFDIPADVYHADPCPQPSLNQSLAKILLAKTPAHARLAHPRLNPDFEPSHDTKFDIGSAAHKLLLGRGREFAIFDAADWNASGGGKGAKTELHAGRDEARAAGKQAILQHQYDLAMDMSIVARAQLSLYDEVAFIDGYPEVVAIAEFNGTWLRTMMDWRMPTGHILYDYKTTETSASPDALQFRMSGEEWPIQAAFQEFILDKIEPDNAGRREFRIVCQEAYPPYALSVGRISEAALHMARRDVERAIMKWQHCMSTGLWPGYSAEIVDLNYPQHVVARKMERMVGIEQEKTDG